MSPLALGRVKKNYYTFSKSLPPRGRVLLFRIAPPKSALLLPISGTSPKTCSNVAKSRKWDPRGPAPVPRAGLLRGGPNPPILKYLTPNPHIRTEVKRLTTLSKNLWRRRKREERGPEGWDPCHARVQARPSTARWRGTAGVAARRLSTRVVDTLFSMT